MSQSYSPNPDEINQNVVDIRDRLFHTLFVKFSLLYARNVSLNQRRLIEFIILIKAILFFTILSYIHIKFVKSHVQCLDHIVDLWPRDGVLRVEIIKNVPPEYSVQDSYRREREILHLIYKNGSLYDEDEKIDDLKSNHTSNVSKVFRENIKFKVWPSLEQPLSTLILFIKTLWPSDEYIVEYSLEYGFLRLSPATRKRLNISVMSITLDPDEHACFGNKFTRFLLENFHGYDGVLMGSIKIIAEKEGNTGYLSNVISGQHYRFVKMYTARTAYIVALFMMLIFTLAISMILRYSHQQLFCFIIEIFQLLDGNSNTLNFPFASLMTVVLALVGLESIMAEFFNDTTTTFYIIFVVWVAEQYDTVCCTTPITKKHWLKFFYLYHYLFYAYHNRFNGQYNILAFVTSWLFIQHSMVYFYHHFELPNILQNHLSNQSYSFSPNNNTTDDDGDVNDENLNNSDPNITENGTDLQHSGIRQRRGNENNIFPRGTNTDITSDYIETSNHLQENYQIAHDNYHSVQNLNENEHSITNDLTTSPTNETAINENIIPNDSDINSFDLRLSHEIPLTTLLSLKNNEEIFDTTNSKLKIPQFNMLGQICTLPNT